MQGQCDDCHVGVEALSVAGAMKQNNAKLIWPHKSTKNVHALLSADDRVLHMLRQENKKLSRRGVTYEIENSASYLLGGTRLDFDRDLPGNGTIDTSGLASTKIDGEAWAIQFNATL